MAAPKDPTTHLLVLIPALSASNAALQGQRQPSPRLHHPSRKEREFRRSPPLQHLQFRPKRYAITIFAAAWFVYKLGCNLESFVPRAKKSAFGGQQSTCTRQRVQATAIQGLHQINHLTSVRFDSELYLMGVDGHAPYCMANSTDIFDGDLKLIDRDHQVDGIGSGIAIKEMGTFKFRLEDNEGQVHTILVPNSLYVPSLKRVLLAPHHWAQKAPDDVPNPRGTRMATDDDCIILYWNQGKSKHTILLSKNTNTPLTRTTSGTETYHAYSAVIKALKACTPHSRRDCNNPSCLANLINCDGLSRLADPIDHNSLSRLVDPIDCNDLLRLVNPTNCSGFLRLTINPVEHNGPSCLVDLDATTSAQQRQRQASATSSAIISNIFGKQQQQHRQASAKSLVGFSSNLQSRTTSLLRQVNHSQCQASISLSLDDINPWCPTNFIFGDTTLPPMNQSFSRRRGTLPLGVWFDSSIMRPRKINATNTTSNGSYLFSLLDRDWSVKQRQEKVATNNPRTNTDDGTGALDFATPCKELAYPVETVSTYASISSDTQAKGGETKSSHKMGSNYSEVSIRMEMNQATGTKYFWVYSDMIDAFRTCTPHSCWKHVLQPPNHQEPPSDDNKFSAEENLILVSHGKREVCQTVLANDETVKFSYIWINISTESTGISKIKSSGTLTFDPSPSDKQTECMLRLYHLWHLSLPKLKNPKLKNLAKMRKMPKHLANVLPLVCAGGDSAAIPKALWRGRETALPVFTTTKSGYKFVHLMPSLVAAKRVFEWNTSESGLYIFHYHAYDGCFFDIDFQAACKQGGQHLEGLDQNIKKSSCQQPVWKTAVQGSCQTQSTMTSYDVDLHHHAIHSHSTIMTTSDTFTTATEDTSFKPRMGMSIDWQGDQAHPPTRLAHAFDSALTISRESERGQCVLVESKQRGERSTVASHFKNSQAEDAPCGLQNNACQQHLHTHAQWFEITTKSHSERHHQVNHSFASMRDQDHKAMTITTGQPRSEWIWAALTLLREVSKNTTVIHHTLQGTLLHVKHKATPKNSTGVTWKAASMLERNLARNKRALHCHHHNILPTLKNMATPTETLVGHNALHIWIGETTNHEVSCTNTLVVTLRASMAFKGASTRDKTSKRVLWRNKLPMFKAEIAREILPKDPVPERNQLKLGNWHQPLEYNHLTLIFSKEKQDKDLCTGIGDSKSIHTTHTSIYLSQPSCLTKVSGILATTPIRMPASTTTMTNESICTNLCTRKFSGWEQSHEPTYLKGVYSTITTSTTVHPPCLPAKIFGVNKLPSKGMYKPGVMPTLSWMTAWTTSKSCCFLGSVTQDTKVRECKVMYTLTLTLPSTRLSGNSRGLMFQKIGFTVVIAGQPQQPKWEDNIIHVPGSLHVPSFKQGLLVLPLHEHKHQ